MFYSFKLSRRYVYNRSRKRTILSLNQVDVQGSSTLEMSYYLFKLRDVLCILGRAKNGFEPVSG